MQKVIAGSRNRVDASQLLAALKTGGVALSQRSNEAFYLGSEPLIQEFGGQRYGTGAMSIYQNLVQSRGTITAQQELYRLGLLDKDRVQFNQLGQLKKALPGAFKGSEILEKQGELALLNQVLLPAFAAKGITSDEDIIRELGMIIGNRTGSGLMSRIYQQRHTIAMQSEANKNALGINQLADKANQTLEGKELDLHAKWRDVLKELGTAVLPIAIKAVEGLTTVFKGVTAFAREFPLLTKGLVIAFGVLAGLVAVGGTIMLAKSAFSALGLALSAGGGLATMLNAAASSIGGLGAALGKAGLLAGVGYAAYQGATWLGADKLGSWLGGKIYDMTHDDPLNPRKQMTWAEMTAPRPMASPYIAGRTTAGQRIEVPVNLNGREIARAVHDEWGREARRPSASGTRFDGSMSPVSPGMTGAH